MAEGQRSLGRRSGAARPREREIAAFDDTASKRNEDAMRRLHDLLTLAGFYRPFLFCFDQTELFTAAPDLCAEFGGVIEQLVNHGLNHMIVVTTNLKPWARVIVRNFQTAHVDRFSAPIELEGMTQPQALAMARQRFAGCGVDDTEIQSFVTIAGSTGFSTTRKRTVFGLSWICARRCADLSEGRAAVAPELGMKDYYAHYEREVRSKPVVFDPDVLRWSVGEEVAAEHSPASKSNASTMQSTFSPSRGKAARGRRSSALRIPRTRAAGTRSFARLQNSPQPKRCDGQRRGSFACERPSNKRFRSRLARVGTEV